MSQFVKPFTKTQRLPSERKPHFLKKLRPFSIFALVVFVYIWAFRSLQIDPALFQDGWHYITLFLKDFWPPDPTVLDRAIRALIETIQMSLLGTTIGAVISLPIAIFSAHNIAPTWLQWIANFLQNAVRSLPSIVLALIFVAALGLGAPAGTLALGIYSVGYLAKFYQEAIESVDARSLEFLQVTGASWLQIAQYGILPQVLPLSLGYTLYMFEYNIRAASILGVVGAGGIGYELITYIHGFERTKAATIILVLLGVVTLIDALSSKLRQRLETQ